MSDGHDNITIEIGMYTCVIYDVYCSLVLTIRCRESVFIYIL